MLQFCFNHEIKFIKLNKYIGDKSATQQWPLAPQDGNHGCSIWRETVAQPNTIFGSMDCSGSHLYLPAFEEFSSTFRSWATDICVLCTF